MTTWYGHFPLSHPWMPSRKRKLSNSPDFAAAAAPDVADPLEPRTPSLKRRRYDLARTLSQLSLFEHARGSAQSQPPSALQGASPPSAAGDDYLDVSPWPSAPPGDACMDADGDVPVIDAVRPVVEEPADVRPPVSEVRMHNTSSYEPEKDRVVITDLDSSEDESETPPHTPGDSATQYSVSPAFLSRLKAAEKFATPLMRNPSPLGDPDPSRAVVLFKPSPWIAKDPHELDGMYRARDLESEDRELVVTEVASADVDAMDVE